MTENEFKIIESELSIELPCEYKKTIIDYPFTNKFEHDVSLTLERFEQILHERVYYITISIL